MTISIAVALYITIWWVVLFAVLPFGVTSQHETGHVVEGTDPGAPAAPRLVRKALWTTLVSTLVFVGILVAVHYFG